MITVREANITSDIGIAKSINQIKWQVEQDNLGAIKFYQRLGASINIKGLFSWDLTN